MSLKDLFQKLTGKKTSREFAPRAPRVTLNYLHRAEFHPHAPWPLETLWITNISSSGLGLVLPPGFKSPETSTIEGAILIDSREFPIALNIVWKNDSSVGGSFINPSPEFLIALQKYFDAELTALRLKPVPADYLKKPEVGEPHWFQGANKCELSYASDGNTVLSFAFTVFGNHFEGGLGKPLRFSEVVQAEDKGKAGFKGSEILQQQRKADPEFIFLALRMLKAIEGINPAHRDAIEAELKRSSN